MIETKHRIALVGQDQVELIQFADLIKDLYQVYSFDNIFEFIQWSNRNTPVSLVITITDLHEITGIAFRKNCKNIIHTANVPFIVIVDKITEVRKKYSHARAICRYF